MNARWESNKSRSEWRGAKNSDQISVAISLCKYGRVQERPELVPARCCRLRCLLCADMLLKKNFEICAKCVQNPKC